LLYNIALNNLLCYNSDTKLNGDKMKTAYKSGISELPQTDVDFSKGIEGGKNQKETEEPMLIYRS